MAPKKKLIEVALPLEAINREAAREKSIRHGHPSTLHLWWARRPLAACRAVLFASLVDDPSSRPEEFPTEKAQDKERQRLFRLIEELVKWENSTNETVLDAARKEILKSTDGNPPPVLDPFCGGGPIPLEAQRLGLEAHGSDLNPVAVLITKALIEIPPKFAGRPPVNSEAQQKRDISVWKGAQGLAEDVRYYGKWMRDEAEKRIGHLYPKAKLPKELGGGDATVIAWLWARTVKCPNPACGAEMPLVRSFALSTKKGKETWVEPVVEPGSAGVSPAVRFEVKSGKGKPPEGTVGRKGARCLVCEEAVPLNHIRAEAKAGRLGAKPMAIVAEGAKGRVYLAPTKKHQEIAESASPENVPETNLPEQALGFRVQGYGMTRHRDLFTPRQLVALTTFSDLVSEARERVLADARSAGMAKDGKGLEEGGSGAAAYADAVATYLAFTVSRLADRSSNICSWDLREGQGRESGVRNVFARQAIPMTWDFAEANPMSEVAASMVTANWRVSDVLDRLPAYGSGAVRQADATSSLGRDVSLISTDPPYYDNIGYADLSDYFYVWLRRSLSRLFPMVCSTLLVPKAQELVATPYRFEGDKAKAEKFFEDGLGAAFGRMREIQHSDFPLTVYYAFKQAESEENGLDSKELAVASTGWETMLEGLIQSGFLIDGTWPMRSELSNRMIASGTNALASSVVLVCRPRSEDAPLATRKEFVAALKRELPKAVRNLQHGNIAPVDLAQASIGPGMAIYSRYAKVVEADGSRMPVRAALGHINQVLDEALAEQESEFDRDTRWALAWFEQHGMEEGAYGDAETLSKAKDTAVSALEKDGILVSKKGKVRLLRREELDPNWTPKGDTRLTVWEVAQHLIRRLEGSGEEAAAELLREVGSLGEVARDLSYRLYSICERKK